MGAPVQKSPRMAGALRWVILCCLLAVTCVGGLAQAEQRLHPSGWVNDFAGVISTGVEQQLEASLTELHRGTGAEVALVTLPSVPDGDVDTAAVELFEAWEIGKKGKDNGVLILCAVEDRRIRIEVGYGLEGILPDAKTGRIIDQQMLPHFRGGDLATGLVGGTLAVASVIAEDRGVKLSGPASMSRRGDVRDSRGGRSSLVRLLFLALFALLFIRNPRLLLLMMLMGGGRGYGGYHRGGFGGGFGGFGGGLSGGGGATRGW